jgi:hypothetical protein
METLQIGSMLCLLIGAYFVRTTATGARRQFHALNTTHPIFFIAADGAWPPAAFSLYSYRKPNPLVI